MEYIGELTLSNKTSQKELQKKLSEDLALRAERLVHHMQMNKVDSIGIGTYVRNSISLKEWTSLNWKKDIYPNVEVDCHFKVKIKDFGKTR